jgi:tRNA A37 threonylcarbamoyladenosine dehydratase
LNHWLDRQTALIGQSGAQRLNRARIAVIGLGGVGGSALEALVRSGIGHLFVMDGGVVDVTNLNRQILATVDTLDHAKSDVAVLRARTVNPEVEIVGIHAWFGTGNAQALLAFKPDYVVEASDSVAAKLALVAICKEHQIPLILSMDVGNCMDGSAFCIGDIEQAADCGCPLACVIRRALHKQGQSAQTVLYSAVPALKPNEPDAPPGAMAYVPPAAGLLLVQHVVMHLLKGNGVEGTAASID